MKNLVNQFWFQALVVLVVYFFLASFLVGMIANAHDVYTGLYSSGKRDGVGQLCCGGNDCEVVSYKVLPSGDAIMDSQCNGVPVLIAKEKITWMPVPGDEAHEAHWCGRTKQGMTPSAISDPTQIDPMWYTYCAFIAPGGV